MSGRAQTTCHFFASVCLWGAPSICSLVRSRAKRHTLGAVIEATERLTGREIERAYVDKGYRGHDTANPRRVFISGQKRGVFGLIKRELRRRSAIEAVIGHMNTDGHLGSLGPCAPQAWGMKCKEEFAMLKGKNLARPTFWTEGVSLLLSHA